MSRVDRYQNPEVYQPLATEYVLGTLQGHARRRFQHLLEQRPYLQEAVDYWSARLNPLCSYLPEAKPPERVWQTIRRRIMLRPVSDVSPEPHGWWNNLHLWRTTAFVSMVLLVTLLVFNPSQQSYQPSDMPAYVAVLENAGNQPMIIATTMMRPKMIKVSMMDEPSVDVEHDWEFWAIPNDGSVPVSMGLVKRAKETVFMLDDKQWAMLPSCDVFAISLEPKGGSPTGGPTGPVMYKGANKSFL